MARLYWNISLAVFLCAFTAQGVFAQGGRLGISADQRAQLKSMAENTRRETETARKEIARSRRELFGVYSVYELDNTKAKSLMGKIDSAQKTLLKAHLNSQVTLRGILSREQFEALGKRIGRRGREERPAGGDFGPGMDERGYRRFGLGRDQMNRMAKSTREEADIVAKLRQDTQRLLALYSDYDLDEAEAGKLVDKIHGEQVQLSTMNNSRQQTLRTALTKDQFEQLMKSQRPWKPQRPR